MQSQKANEFATLTDRLFSVDKVQYVAIANVFGEVEDICCRRGGKSSSPSKEILSGNLRKITLATNILTFENIRLMVLDIAASKTLIINLSQDTIMVGMDNDDATMSDIVRVLECFY